MQNVVRRPICRNFIDYPKIGGSSCMGYPIQISGRALNHSNWSVAIASLTKRVQNGDHMIGCHLKQRRPIRAVKVAVSALNQERVKATLGHIEYRHVPVRSHLKDGPSIGPRYI